MVDYHIIHCHFVAVSTNWQDVGKGLFGRLGTCKNGGTQQTSSFFPQHIMFMLCTTLSHFGKTVIVSHAATRTDATSSHQMWLSLRSDSNLLELAEFPTGHVYCT